MALPNIFTKEVSDEVILRINNLKADTLPVWGKMNAAQMLAHCNVPYELVFENIHKKPNALMKFLIKLVAKNKIVGEEPFGRNLKTGPQFVINDSKNFEIEKQRLIKYINKTQNLGESEFDNKESATLGVLNKTEWNNMFYKHLDHHLSQFGV